ncbi:MAG: hypothetical protein K2X27_26640 [Candidatus Obscuribacterales bacterium]|nr:hypothetical protein [Candidatus Obscuribacterales bacterium]
MKVLSEISIELKSPLRLQSRDGLSAATSLPADRLFSFIAIGWNRLFGSDSLLEKVISPFLSKKEPWIHSDLFPASESEIFIPALVPSSSRGDLIGSVENHYLPLNSILSCSDKAAPQFQKNLVSTISLLKASREQDLKKHLSHAAGLCQSQNGSKEQELFFKGLIRANPEYLPLIERVLDFMQSEGIGGYRSSGAGEIAKIELRESSLKLPEPEQNTNKRMILSACCPSPESIERIKASPAGSNQYRLRKSSGWIYDKNGQPSGLQKAATYYFETGSIFSVAVEGQLIDLSREQHPCFRYGIPFTIAVP